MAEFDSPELTSSVMARLAQSREQIAKSLEQIANGNPLGAEPEPTRAVARLQAKASLSRAEATLMANAIRATADDIKESEAGTGERKPLGAEAILGQTLDFVGVSFLTRGRAAANAVARIAHRNGDRAKGSGFLVAPGILLTNNHVIRSEGEAADLVAQFDYELDDQGRNRVVTEFELDPRFFVFDPIERLDYTLIGLGARRSGPHDLKDFGYLTLSDASDKHMLGEVANVVQHPLGRFKEIVLRENRLVARLGYVLHYLADTEPGSSGSPVFNNDWQAIALHHWGGPSPAVLDGLRQGATTEVNEGVRISSIVTDLDGKRAVGSPHGDKLASLLELWQRGTRDDLVPELRSVPAPSRHEGARAPRSSSARSRTTMPREQEDFSDRAGYEPGFVPGFVVPMPELKHVHHEAARNLDARRGDDPHELPYHHFSIVMNAERRLAFFTACNIDGRLTRHVNRQTKEVDEHPTLKQLDIESLDGQEGAEATDAFSLDPRVDSEQQMGVEFYERQIVPGFSNPQSGARRARMFQKGHIIMRGDPAWGTVDMALAAESDSFFYTNAAPQLGFFNQGSPVGLPGQKGKLRWRAVETYVLRNAFTSRERVSVFAGPVFRDRNVAGKKADPVYRGIQVPMEFWKIVVWAEDGALHSIALLADQRQVLERLTQGVPEALEGLPESIEIGPERFDDLVELQRVQEFLSTVEQIESLTGLRFPDLVRRGDIRAGQEALTVSENADAIARRLRGAAARGNGEPRSNGSREIVIRAGTMPSAHASKSATAKPRSGSRSRPTPRPHT
jgi:endonuclease G